MGEEPSQKQVVWKQMVMLKVSHPALLVAPDGEQYWYLIFCFRSISIDTLNFYYENWSAICLWAICYRIILSEYVTELFWANYFERITLSEFVTELCHIYHAFRISFQMNRYIISGYHAYFKRHMNYLNVLSILSCIQQNGYKDQLCTKLPWVGGSEDELIALLTAKQTTYCTICLFSCLFESKKQQLSPLLYLP